MAGPAEGSQLLYADCPAWMIKAVKAIVDTTGHYARPDVVRVILNSGSWLESGGHTVSIGPKNEISIGELQRAADLREVETDRVKQVADEFGLSI